MCATFQRATMAEHPPPGCQEETWPGDHLHGPEEVGAAPQGGATRWGWQTVNSRLGLKFQNEANVSNF